MISFLLVSALVGSTTLEVGPGKPFSRIEQAVSVAHEGDSILVYPDPSGYPKTAILVRTPSLTIRGVSEKPVIVKGDGFDYSGSGGVPRAIFQFDPESKGSKIQNFDLSGAHNETYNGAGIRIQAASAITVSDCLIHDNDMGIMSNGIEGNDTAGSDQLIEYCLIERNGNQKDPGYNHNLYLGGTSVTLTHCEIRRSTTGHNLKSRAHYIVLQGNYIHDAANREIDLPEAWDTVRADSNAVLIGNRIIKDPNCQGNRGVIHFGAEKGSRKGNLYLFGNTIVTPFFSPIILVSSLGTEVKADQNLFINHQQNKATLWESTTKDTVFSATDNGLSPGYGPLKGNSTAETRADTFGRTQPEYLKKLRSGTGKVPRYLWHDGKGKEVVMDGLRDDLSRIVGPRPGR